MAQRLKFANDCFKGQLLTNLSPGSGIGINSSNFKPRNIFQSSTYIHTVFTAENKTKRHRRRHLTPKPWCGTLQCKHTVTAVCFIVGGIIKETPRACIVISWLAQRSL